MPRRKDRSSSRRRSCRRTSGDSPRRFAPSIRRRDCRYPRGPSNVGQKGPLMTSRPRPNWEILADPEALARRVAEWLLAAATAKDGVFAVALSGGSTPRRLYEHLAGPPYRDLFPWSRTHWFWGDERSR